MPILPQIGRKRWSHRTVVLSLYIILSALGATMVVPFLITVTGSVSNDLDYQRFRAVPRFIYSQEERFAKGLTAYFNGFGSWRQQLRANFPAAPESWTTWIAIGRDDSGIAALARDHLRPADGNWAAWERQARDYAEFVLDYPAADLLVPVDKNNISGYLEAEFAALWRERSPTAAAEADRTERRAGALDTMGDVWGVRFNDFATVNFNNELNAPVWQQRWLPPVHAKMRTFVELKEAYRRHQFSPGIEAKWRAYFAAFGPAKLGASDLTEFEAPWPLPEDASGQLRALWREFVITQAPAVPVLPFALRTAWLDYLASDEVRAKLGLPETATFGVANYNRLAGTRYDNLWRTPFPLPADFPSELQAIWRTFVETRWPLRLTTFDVTPALQATYAEELQKRLLTLPIANQMFKTEHDEWSDFKFSPTPPGADQADARPLWLDIGSAAPVADRILECSELAFQRSMLARYGEVGALNTAWGTRFTRIEEVFPPFAAAYAVHFRNHEWALTLTPIARNYGTISDFLLYRGDAVRVTLILVVLSVLVSLTVNPITAYALSRFNMRGQDKIILFLIATSAFPGMISAIPGFLLMRDLGLLNTFLALLLPGAANGMAIFILKGFFDSLPAELYEAATIDGAKEWQIFIHVSLPLITPILAVNALGAFMGAYSGWEWALIIAQDERMWTVSVWMIQANQWLGDTPWVTSAGFIIVSIPVLIVFLTCQKIILQGIILPQMK